MDPLFLRQVWAGNEALLLDLLEDETPLGRARLHYFLINKGPWSRLDEDAPFIPGVPAKPRGRQLLPARARPRRRSRPGSKALPRGAGGEARGFFTTIRRGPDGRFTRRALQPRVPGRAGAGRGRCCARRPASPRSPRSRRTSRPARRPSCRNDYYASDVAWMELDASIEPTIGPYEVYEDEWFNYKAAFEAFVALRDDAETAKLARFGGELQDIEDHLPIDPALRNPKLGRAGAHPRGQRRLHRRATPTAACRPPPSTSPTTSAWSRRRAASG